VKVAFGGDTSEIRLLVINLPKALSGLDSKILRFLCQNKYRQIVCTSIGLWGTIRAERDLGP
jgi:hypothetical protein